MLREVRHARTICGLGVCGWVLCVVMLTWVYPYYCGKAQQIKEAKVREYVQEHYGVTDHLPVALSARDSVRGEQSARREAALSPDEADSSDAVTAIRSATCWEHCPPTR